jgi:hypothetical protein
MAASVGASDEQVVNERNKFSVIDDIGEDGAIIAAVFVRRGPATQQDAGTRLATAIPLQPSMAFAGV